ncbi:hypothetical protein PanWU01x14_143770, partial [Parasponia andersonii]
VLSLLYFDLVVHLSNGGDLEKLKWAVLIVSPCQCLHQTRPLSSTSDLEVDHVKLSFRFETLHYRLNSWELKYVKKRKLLVARNTDNVCTQSVSNFSVFSFPYDCSSSTITGAYSSSTSSIFFIDFLSKRFGEKEDNSLNWVGSRGSKELTASEQSGGSVILLVANFLSCS